MITFNPDTLCNNAREHYYNYISAHFKQIPQDTYEHINRCHYCQEEIKRLKNILSGKKTLNYQKDNVVITHALKLHFAYEGSPVTCRNVRPFLPSLADACLTIRVPTPITVHVDNCPKCSEELHTIHNLHLTHKQLCHLGQLLAEVPIKSKKFCEKAQEAIPDVVSMSIHKTKDKILRHLCTCSNCRQRIYKRRAQVIEQLQESNFEFRKFPCEKVLESDIFDYCLPYGINPENDEYTKFRQSFTSHVSGCRKCLNKMQQLHTTLSNILEASESDIVTSYKIVGEKIEEKQAVSDDIYSDWPIEVEVFDKSSLKAASTIKLTETATPKTPKLTRFSQIVSAAAVILIIIFLTFFNTGVKAVGLEQIYDALGKLKNIYLATYSADESRIVQEKWISSNLNAMMFKMSDQNVMWDINSKSKKTIDLNTKRLQTIDLDQASIANTKESMKAPWGLLPFNSISAAPKNTEAKWEKAEDETAASMLPNTEIYQLLWKEELFDGTIIYKKWNGYIDKQTRLPKRIETWEKTAEENEYKPTYIIKIDYPSDDEIQQKIEELGFESSSNSTLGAREG